VYQSHYSAQAANNLYGAQIGLRWSSNWKRLSISGNLKTGIYANSASQDQYLIYNQGTNAYPIRDLSTSNSTVSFIQELGLTGVYQLTEVCSIRAGYNLFVISGVARATEQIDFSTNPLPAFSTHGAAVLHGPSAGIEYRF
jgi:hypothetical protein